MNMDEYEKDKIRRNVIRKLKPSLMQEIIPSQIIPITSILSTMDEENILSEEKNHGSIQAASMFLDRIMKRGPKWYDTLLGALRDCEKSHLATVITEEVEKMCPRPPSPSPPPPPSQAVDNQPSASAPYSNIATSQRNDWPAPPFQSPAPPPPPPQVDTRQPPAYQYPQQAAGVYPPQQPVNQQPYPQQPNSSHSQAGNLPQSEFTHIPTTNHPGYSPQYQHHTSNSQPLPSSQLVHVQTVEYQPAPQYKPLPPQQFPPPSEPLAFPHQPSQSPPKQSAVEVPYLHQPVDKQKQVPMATGTEKAAVVMATPCNGDTPLRSVRADIFKALHPLNVHSPLHKDWKGLAACFEYTAEDVGKFGQSKNPVEDMYHDLSTKNVTLGDLTSKVQELGRQDILDNIDKTVGFRQPEPTGSDKKIEIDFPQHIDGGLVPGKMITICGALPVNVQRFSVNLQVGTSTEPRADIAIHISVRVTEGTIVRNTLVNEEWQKEEREIKFQPFLAGTEFELVIKVEKDMYKVDVNGLQFCDYKHRILPLKKIDTLDVSGEVRVNSVDISVPVQELPDPELLTPNTASKAEVVPVIPINVPDVKPAATIPEPTNSHSEKEISTEPQVPADTVPSLSEQVSVEETVTTPQVNQDDVLGNKPSEAVSPLPDSLVSGMSDGANSISENVRQEETEASASSELTLMEETKLSPQSAGASPLQDASSSEVANAVQEAVDKEESKDLISFGTPPIEATKPSLQLEDSSPLQDTGAGDSSEAANAFSDKVGVEDTNEVISSELPPMEETEQLKESGAGDSESNKSHAEAGGPSDVKIVPANITVTQLENDEYNDGRNSRFLLRGSDENNEVRETAPDQKLNVSNENNVVVEDEKNFNTENNLAEVSWVDNNCSRPCIQSSDLNVTTEEEKIENIDKPADSSLDENTGMEERTTVGGYQETSQSDDLQGAACPESYSYIDSKKDGDTRSKQPSGMPHLKVIGACSLVIAVLAALAFRFARK
ncbi:uncharacterized protein LOC100376748 [Saccoglossus kowalevskii]|uniref:Uncharacterized protein LOC100376748 n=1 Tax=Saccoglossus kowalevskii TaxID=10224 RepID=A0ABM0GZ32_SACKO|nr:PREDICTED: uncharacterized protein LOC100376748 [Saccoglossus kowalevskii]